MQPRVESFPWLWPPRSSAVLWHGLRGAGTLAWLGPRCTVRQPWETWQPVGQTSLCLASRASQDTCTPQEQSPGFSSLFVHPSSPPTSQGGLSPLHRNPGLGYPVCGLTHSLPSVGIHQCNLPSPLSPLRGAQILTRSLFFPFYSIVCVSFLEPWLYRSPSASFQLVFSENCSTCRCILMCLC